MSLSSYNAENTVDAIKTIVQKLNIVAQIKDDDINKFLEYLSENERISDLSIEKIKILLLLFQKYKLNNSEAINQIISFIEQTEYGWNEDTYIFSNPCFRYSPTRHCKYKNNIDSGKWLEKKLRDIRSIFLDNEFSAITLYIFSYCLAGLFCKKLKQERSHTPFFLQIACNNNTVYDLIREIVTICDVNTGILDRCNESYTQKICGLDDGHVTIYPTQYSKDDIDKLVWHKDIPVIIDGRENERYYNTMLREVVNIPNRRKHLNLRDRFNVLPLFICPEIKSRFDNVVSIDLTGVFVSGDFLELIRKNRQMLSEWVFELVSEFHHHHYFSDERPRELTPQDELLHKLNPKRQRANQPMYHEIKKKINGIRKKHIKIFLKDTEYLGFLSFYFDMYMRVFKNVILRADIKEFTYQIHFAKHDIDKLIDSIAVEAEESLIKLHKIHTPAPLEPLRAEIVEIDGVKMNTAQIEKDMKKLAANIEKYYRSYKTEIRIAKGKYENKRYIFDLDLLPGMTTDDVEKYAKYVKKLLHYQFFIVDVKENSTQIFASEKFTKDNSLIKILNSPEFRDSVMEMPYAMGYDIRGNMFISDIAEYAHLLIGGSTGSGKSTALHSLLLSIVCQQTVDDVNLLILDYGASQLKLYDVAPHLSHPVITETGKGHRAIIALQEEMERRKIMLENNDKDFDKLPTIICVIDEFIIFIKSLTHGKENKDEHEIISDLIGRGRKFRIYIVLSALNPTNDNMKCDTSPITARVALKCAKWQNSAAILGAPGAQDLVGKGSMYFSSMLHDGLMYLQGSYIPTEDIPRLFEKFDFENNEHYNGEYNGEYKFTIDEYYTIPPTESSELPKNIKASKADAEFNEKLADIILWAFERGEISIIAIMEKYKMGRKLALKFFNRLENFNIMANRISDRHNKAREIIPKKIEVIPENVMDLLKYNNKSEEDIKNALNKRQRAET